MILAGAGGHALEILDILEAQGVKDIDLYDDINENKVFLRNYKIIKDQLELKNALKLDNQFILALGNPKSREKLFHYFSKLGGVPQSIKGFNSVISSYLDYKYCDILNNCFIGPNTKIGIGTLVNSGVSIHHNTELEDFVEVSPNAVLLGNVKVGKLTIIGANATILPNITIGSNSVIGAGSVVTKNIPDNSLALGVPAKIIKMNK